MKGAINFFGSPVGCDKVCLNLKGWWRGVGRGLRKRIGNCPPPPFLLKNEICSIINTNLYSIVLVGHAFGSVHIHLLEF